MVQMPGTPESSGPHPAAPPYAAPAAGGPNPPPGGPYWPPPPMPYGPPAYPPRSSSRAPLWIVLAAIAVVLVVGVGAVIGVVLSLPARHAEDPDGAASRTHGADSAVQISRTDTQDLVQGRSEALRRKDLKGFLAALDAGNSELLTGQTRLFHNLRKVSFSESRYEVATQRGRTTDQFGRGVTVSVDVSFVHMIEGYDTKRVAELYRWTVVKKDKNSRPVITAVAGAPSDSLTSESKTQFYPAPWDKWNDIKVVRTEHVLLMADQSMAAQAERYAPIAERAAADDLAAWQASGTSGQVFQRFVTSLVPDKEQLGTLFQMTRKKEVTEAGFSMPLPEFNSGGAKFAIGATRVVMDTSSGFFKPDHPTGPQEIFRHEFAHSMVEALNKYDNPDALFLGQENWILEGFAEYLANRGASGATLRTAHARQLVRNGTFRDRLPSALTWNVEGEEMLDFNYYLGHQAIRYMATKYGEPKAFGFVAAYYQGARKEDAFRQALGVEMATFEREWATFVREQTR